jgi:hypothetical protein
MPGELVQLGEGVGIEQQLDTLASRLLTSRELLLDCFHRTRMNRLLHAAVQVSQLSAGRVDVRRRSRAIHD